MQNDFNPFEELGVDTDADDAAIKAAWRQAAMKYHPDRNKDDPDAARKFARSKLAYQQLKDEGSRRAAAVAFGAARRRASHHAAFDDFFRQVDIAAAPWRNTGADPVPGADLRRSLTLSLEQAFRGGHFAVQHDAARCAACQGSGRRRITGMATCPQCAGTGGMKAANGVLRVTMSCPVCEGRGKVPWSVCTDCGGVGQVRAVSADVIVPPGVDNGHRVVLKGLGAPGTGGAPTGNLVVEVEVRRHQAFGREGTTLTHRLQVPVWDAALGTRRVVRGIDGRQIDVVVPPGCRPGQVVAVEGAGMPDRDGRRGSLAVRIDVIIPKATEGRLQELFRTMKREFGV